MSEHHAQRYLQIEEDMKLQQRFWVIERFGWTAMGLVIVAALLGAFGDGRLSAATAKSGQDLQVEYERFGRYQRPIHLRVHALPSPAGDVRLWVSQDYLNKVQVEFVNPMPDTAFAGSGRTTYVFRSSGGASTITLKVRPDTLGTLPAKIGLEAGPTVEFAHYLFP
jgi:hypothetical protein